ncbi:methyl-accepting chemotaxis protein [Cellulomonas sp. P24]|uniref:methyl-accepting chemotaxis protein n=1 Tax=Cellulomonas sp. P24 TaxID=2885206 RepID=UPI00216AD248|nr:methyl-accepting chemotaxis protein [Cellulomonas sp. P24]
MSTKILSVIGLLVLVVIGSGTLAITSLRAVAHDSAMLADVQANVVVPLSGLHEAQLKARMLAAQVAAAEGADAKKKWLADQVTNDGEIDGEIAAFEKAAPSVFPGWKDFVTGWAAWKQARDTKLIPPALANDRTGYEDALLNVTEPLKDAYLNNLELVQGAVTTYSTGVAADAAAGSSSAIRTLVISLTVALAAAIALAVVVARGIVRSVVSVKRSVEGLARGDLTVRPAVFSGDELGQMAQALVVAQDALRGVVSGVVETAGTVASAAEELSASSSQVSAGSVETSVQAGVVAAAAEQVSRNVQAVAAGAEQMGASIREIAQNANEAARVAGQATGVAAATNETVVKLGVSSQEIGNVVKVITSIAEQTNLLALNATIEAAGTAPGLVDT